MHKIIDLNLTVVAETSNDQSTLIETDEVKFSNEIDQKIEQMWQLVNPK